MIEELNNFLGLGIEVAEDATDEQKFDAVKTAFNAKGFITMDEAKSNKDLESHFYTNSMIAFDNMVSKNLDIDLKDTKGLKEKLEVINSTYSSKIEALKGDNDPTEEYKTLETKYNTLKGDFDLKNSAVETLSSELETAKTTLETEKTNWIKGSKEKDLWSKVKISDTKDEIWKAGFETTFKSKYQFDLEGDNLVVLKDGEKIPNPNKHGDWLNPIDVLKSELESAGGLKKNNVDPTPTPTPTPQPSNGRRVHPNAN